MVFFDNSGIQCNVFCGTKKFTDCNLEIKQNLASALQVAAIRGSIMGAGISLVAAMDYVVAPESRSLRRAAGGFESQ